MPAYECSACTDPLSGRRLRLENERICPPCLTQLFEIAIQDETEYPAHWGKLQIDVDRCTTMLPEDVVTRYRLAGQEYAIPAGDRVYCRRTDPPRRPDPCNSFVGAWKKQRRCVRCERCLWYTCLRCEESFSTSGVRGESTTIEHECNPERSKDIHLRPLRGLLKGKDYQFCPNEACNRVWALHDGCNHMRCACKTHFCFICGKAVQDGKGHWRSKGGCPRWNFPGDANAQYDETDHWNDNGVWNEDVPEEDDLDQAALARWQAQFRNAVAKGRAYIFARDPDTRALISGLTMHIDPQNNMMLVFRDKKGTRVSPLYGLNSDQMPSIIIRPRLAARGALWLLPEAINHAVLRLFGLKRKVVLTPRISR